MERRLTKEDAQRLCRICKSNGFFVNVEYDLEEHSYVVTIKEVKIQTEVQDYEKALQGMLSNINMLKGWKEKGKIYIPKTPVNEYLTANDIDPFSFTKWLESSGVIAKRQSRKRTTQVRVGNKAVRCLVLHDFDFEEEC